MSLLNIKLYSPATRPLKFCGATEDGRVLFTPAGAELLSRGPFRGELTADDAKTLGEELRAAAGVAEEFLARARGDHLWKSVAALNGRFLVTHRGQHCHVRPIVNNARKNGRLWKCTACPATPLTGATMYVPEAPHPWGFNHVRLCSACVQPSDNPRLGAALHVPFTGAA